MTAGQQLAQTCHAVTEFCYEFPQEFKEWIEKSRYIVSLSTQDMKSLNLLVELLEKNDISFSSFREPDLDNQLTAIAIDPSSSEEVRKLLSSLPLALKEFNVISNQLDKEREVMNG